MSGVRVERVVRRSDKELGEGGGRMLALGVLVFGWLFLLGFRLYDLQVRDHSHFAELAKNQQQTVVELDAPRGSILDAAGRELAVSVQVQSIYVNPREVASQERTQEVTELLISELRMSGEPAAQFRARMQGDGTFVWAKRKLDPVHAEEIAALELPGVYLLEESRRDYPMGTLASHVLGYVGLDNVGLAGLEYRYDDVVRGRSAQRRVLRDASGARFVAPWSLEETPAPGTDLILTIDATLQHLAERALADAVRRHRAQAGIFVLLDARDSAVLAMANVPDFDPNRFGSFGQEARRNRAVLDAYEPGSTFKMVTAAAALDTLTVRPDDRFDCENGAIVVDSMRIGDHKPFGVLTFREVIARSSNVGTIKAALRLGADPLRGFVEDFGFGQSTGIDLAGENVGLVQDASRWNRLTAAYVSFGQGLSASPLQLANAYAALASGAMHQPYLVRGVREGADLRLLERPAPRKLELSAATRKDLIRLLEGVVEDGTGTKAAILGFRVAGKTGTAEKSNSSGYSATDRLASFVGMVPAGAPRLVGLVMVDRPRDLTGGGEVAAPVFREVIKSALLYLGVSPDREVWDRRDDFLALRRQRERAPAEQPAPADLGAEALEEAVEIAALRLGAGS